MNSDIFAVATNAPNEVHTAKEVMNILAPFFIWNSPFVKHKRKNYTGERVSWQQKKK